MTLKNLLLFVALIITSPASAQTVLIHCGTLLDPGTSMDAQTERSIVVEDGVITKVESGFITAKTADTVVDLRDSFCMPGLMDMHTHLTGETRKGGYIDKFRDTPARRALKAAKHARTTLMAGFTTVRDIGGPEGVDIALRNAINAGDIIGPRMFVAGQSLAITGGHADGTNGYREDIVGIPDATNGVVDGVDSAIRATRINIKRGVDQIKITATGGVLSIAADGSKPAFRDEEITAIVETAANRGLKVAAHAHGDAGMRQAVRLGVKSIEHGTYMSDETMKLMIEKGAYLVPTITAGKSVADSARIENYYVPVVTAKALEIGPVIQGTFGRAYKAGVPIAFGTDAGVFVHGKNALEFGYMVEAGMPPMEAIKAATVNSADLLGKYEMIGSIEVGKQADIVAVRENPLEEISAMTDVSFVMKQGVIYKQHGRPLR